MGRLLEGDGAERNMLLDSVKPIFVVETKDGHRYEIFENGMTAGFADVSFIYNGIAIMKIKAEAEAMLKELK